LLASNQKDKVKQYNKGVEIRKEHRRMKSITCAVWTKLCRK